MCTSEGTCCADLRRYLLQCVKKIIRGSLDEGRGEIWEIMPYHGTNGADTYLKNDRKVL